MEQPKISILVPVYKVEAYLGRCIESVLSQDFTDFELILVDDGSPDLCGKICDDYARIDSRVKVIHQVNGGLASARLSAYQAAVGKYFLFVDSDDYLLPNALRLLYEEIEEGYDIVRTSPLRVTEKGEQWVEHYDFEDGVIDDKDIYIQYLLRDKIAPYLHGAIFKSSLFTEEDFAKNIKYRISIGEDWIINFNISARVNKALFLPQSTYAYFINTSSMMHQKVISWEYRERTGKAVAEAYAQLPPALKTLSDNLRLVGQLRYYFIPEVSFNHQNFPKLQANIHQAIQALGKGCVDRKFYFLIDYKWLFYIYSRLLCLYYYVRKYKCKSRDILK